MTNTYLYGNQLEQAALGLLVPTVTEENPSRGGAPGSPDIAVQTKPRVRRALAHLRRARPEPGFCRCGWR